MIRTSRTGTARPIGKAAVDLAAVDPIPRLTLRPPGAAEALDISDRTLSTWTKAGKIPVIKIGGTVLYSIDALREWARNKSSELMSAQADDEARRSAEENSRPLTEVDARGDAAAESRSPSCEG